MQTEFDNKARILNLAATYVATCDCDVRAIYNAVKAENAGRNEALFVVASFLAIKTNMKDLRTHRRAVNTIESLFDSLACEFMNYDDFISLAAELGKIAAPISAVAALNLFELFELTRDFDCLNV